MSVKKWTKQSIEDNLRGLSVELGHFPSCNELRCFGYAGMLTTIHQQRWSLLDFKERLGFKATKRHRWNRANALSFLKSSIDASGRFPTQREIQELGGGGLWNFMISIQSVSEWESELGLSPRRRPLGYWQVWDNLELEIRKIIKDETFPSVTRCVKEIDGHCAAAIWHFGGIKEVAKRMGFQPSNLIQTSDGHFVRSSYEYIFDEFLFKNNIVHEVDGRIHQSRRFRYDFRVKDLFFEIWGLDNEKTTRGKQYKIKRIEKEVFYKQLGLNVIPVEIDLFQGGMVAIFERLEKCFGDVLR